MQVVVDGVIAPWLWNGNSYFLAPLYDVGIFGPAGSVLTGDRISIEWTSDPVIANITVNDTTTAIGPLLPTDPTVNALVTPTFQSITYSTNPHIDIDSFIPSTQRCEDLSCYSQSFTHGIGGAFDIPGPNNTILSGYYFIDSVAVDGVVITPVADMGIGLPGLAVALLLVLTWGWMRPHDSK
jgi:hypothetical protein